LAVFVVLLDDQELLVGQWVVVKEVVLDAVSEVNVTFTYVEKVETG